jgi:hypothetical protein
MTYHMENRAGRNQRAFSKGALQSIASGGRIMLRDKPKATFVGPVTRKGAQYSFLILQGETDPIMLEYPMQALARQSRAQLLETHHTYPVPSTKLLMAIQMALSEVQQEPLQPGDESSVPKLSPDDKEDSLKHRSGIAPAE